MEKENTQKVRCHRVFRDILRLIYLTESPEQIVNGDNQEVAQEEDGAGGMCSS